MRTARASVLRKTNTAMERELRGLDLADDVCQQSTKFRSLFFRNRRFQILNLQMMLSHKHNERHFGDAGDPRIADQLWIERKQSSGFLRITAGRGLPVHDAPHAIKFTDSVNIGNKLIRVR